MSSAPSLIASLPAAVAATLTSPALPPSPQPSAGVTDSGRWEEGRRNKELHRTLSWHRRQGADETELRGIADALNGTIITPCLPEGEVAHVVRQVLGYEPAEPRAATDTALPVVRTLAEIIADPDFYRLPTAVAERFAWHGRLTLLSGREKLGKTTLTAKVAASVSSGALLFGMEPPDSGPAPVLWCALEGHVDDVAFHLTNFGADPERLLMCDRLGEPATRISTLAALAAQYCPALIVVDTLSSLVAGAIDDAKADSAAWTLWMNGLGQLARDANAAVLVTHHARKSDGRYRDSTAIGAGADMILELLADDKDDSVRVVEAKGRWTVPRFTVRLEGEEYRLADSADALTLDQQVLTYVKQHPGCTQRQLLDRLPGRDQTKRAAIRSLVEGAALTQGPGPGGGFSYTLTATGAERLKHLRAEPL